MKRQFATALSAPVTNQLFLSSWNEFIAQPQPNPFHSTNAFAMGLPSDPERSNLWVDTYGTAIGRDIAPSVQGGSVVFDTMQSCLRVLFLNNGSAAGCSVSNELCCTADPVADLWQPVWSLQRSDGTDFLVTAAANEFHDLIDSKWGSEICNPYVGPTQFCVDSGLIPGPLVSRGPFVLATNAGPGRIALYRCLAGDGRHFISNQANCEGDKVDTLLGYLTSTRTSDTPRSLSRCLHSSGSFSYHYHALDMGCAAGDTQEAVFGYAH